MIILGVDPSLQCSGFSILVRSNKGLVLLDYGVLKMSSAVPLNERIGQFYDFFQSKIDTCKVTHIALETPFLGKNAQTFLKLGYLRGALYVLAHHKKLFVHEFSPTQVKQALTGSGGASKEQVAFVVSRLFPGFVIPRSLDITDAVAVGLCGLWREVTLGAHALR